MKDGAQAIMTALAHVGAAKNHALKVKGGIKDRADQYSESVAEASKRLATTEGDALSDGYNVKAKLGMTRYRGLLDQIKNS
jgi:hypothetical protein